MCISHFFVPGGRCCPVSKRALTSPADHVIRRSYRLLRQLQCRLAQPCHVARCASPTVWTTVCWLVVSGAFVNARLDGNKGFIAETPGILDCSFKAFAPTPIFAPPSSHDIAYLAIFSARIDYRRQVPYCEVCFDKRCVTARCHSDGVVGESSIEFYCSSEGVIRIERQ